MSQAPQQSYPPRGGRGGGFRGGFRGGSRGAAGGRGRGRGRGRGSGRGGFHHNTPKQPIYHPDVDYTPEAIEHRFAAFYLPSMTQDPWRHLSTQQS